MFTLSPYPLTTAKCSSLCSLSSDKTYGSSGFNPLINLHKSLMTKLAYPNGVLAITYLTIFSCF